MPPMKNFTVVFKDGTHRVEKAFTKTEAKILAQAVRIKEGKVYGVRYVAEH